MSSKVTAPQQALEAYRQMRFSLVKFAEAESELHTRSEAKELTPMLESMIVARIHAWRDRAIMFAKVYEVEVSVADRKSSMHQPVAQV